MKRSDFFYALPEELIAQHPLDDRSASRLLVVPPVPQTCVDTSFKNLDALLRPGDLLIFNDTRVIAARVFGQKISGGRVEILLERILSPCLARVQVRANKPLRNGQTVQLDGGGTAKVIARELPFYVVAFSTDLTLVDWLARHGQLPLPPYIRRAPDISDAERYQTIFAKHTGAVAAPTAGLHFDMPLLDRLQSKGIAIGYVTLHVGAGTFQPMRVENIDNHEMHKEWLSVDAKVIDQMHQARVSGGRVIAVGTTVLRALESAVANGVLQPYTGDSQLFIRPGYRITTVQGLITNFHLPESTLLMLVAAFAGYSRIMEAYAYAIALRYRFFSYGDAMFLHAQSEKT